MMLRRKGNNNKMMILMISVHLIKEYYNRQRHQKLQNKYKLLKRNSILRQLNNKCLEFLIKVSKKKFAGTI